jgi:hypothetical protein
MIEVGIMIEGQNGLNWKCWQRIASVLRHTGISGYIARTITPMPIRQIWTRLNVGSHSPGLPPIQSE